MTDLTHLQALQNRLINEKGYLATAKTARERETRMVWIAQIEREIKAEMDFLGGTIDPDLANLSDDDLLNELNK